MGTKSKLDLRNSLRMNLEDLLNKRNELLVALMNQRNVLIIIRDQNFDLIDYLYLKLSNEKGIFF